MMIQCYSKLLLLCAFHGSTAFLVQPPRSLSLTGRQTSAGASPPFLYTEDSDGLGLPDAEGDVDNMDFQVKPTSMSMDIPPFPSIFDMAEGESRKMSPIATTQRALDVGRLGALGQKKTTDATKVGVHSPHDTPFPKQIWDKTSAVHVQGGSLKTWSYPSPKVQRVQLVLNTEGRPLDADIELWQGPDNTPQRMRVYVENGSMRPFSTVIETPRGPDTIAIRNVGQLEFPLAAHVSGETSGPSLIESPELRNGAILIQGGALRTFSFEANIESVQVLLRTDGRPLNARIELIQGPNNNKEIIELYAEDGRERPFYAVLETPGSGNVVRILNSSPVEFPLVASVEPYLVGPEVSGLEAVIGGEPEGFMVDRE